MCEEKQTIELESLNNLMNKWFIILFVLVCIGLMYGRFEGLIKLMNPY